MMRIFILAIIALELGCTAAEIDKINQAAQKASSDLSVATSVDNTPTINPPPLNPNRISLKWENTDAPHPERKSWSDLVTNHMQKNINVYNQAADIEIFCPKFKKLNDPPKVKALGEIIVAIVYFESGYKPTSWMSEEKMIDPKTGKQVVDSVTNKPVKSEGLLQLSYQDMKSYPTLLKGCGIDWEKDKALGQDDPKKTIFNPFFNLECGLRILTEQVKNKKAITLDKGVYWAVIKKNGNYTKIPEIIERVQKNSPDCK